MKRVIPYLAFVLLVGSTGCVERRYVIESKPQGALVLQNGVPIGHTPCDATFTYYGTYNFTLIKDGYETQTFSQRIAPPWFAYPPIDFVAENLYPGHIEDTRRFCYELRPVEQPQLDTLRAQAEELRAAGRALPPPRKPPEEKPRPQSTQPQPAQPIATAPMPLSPANP